MTEITTSHHTVVVKRSYDVPPARVFAAWRSGEALQRWYVPGGDGWRSAVTAHEFRVGGVKRLDFGLVGGDTYVEDCRYEDIVENQRICFSMTISLEGKRVTTSMVTVEVFARAKGASLTVTDQLVILDGSDTADGRERGWGAALDNLPAELARTA